jgi:hypothetical protein
MGFRIKIKYFFPLIILFFTFNIFLKIFASNKQTIVMIDPAGHAKEPGRLLVEGYERAETFKFADRLRRELAKKTHSRIVLSRSPGEEIMPLQIPSFSNRLGTDFFLRVHMFRQENEKPQIFFYHLLFDPFIDLAKRNNDSLRLIPLRQAHFFSAHKARLCGRKMYEYLNQDSFKKYFDCFVLKGLPISPLVGITAPAILLEIGICREDKWESLVRPIAESMGFL